jgi:hypothetical protein
LLEGQLERLRFEINKVLTISIAATIYQPGKSSFFGFVFGMVQELRRFPTLQAEIATAATEALERFREDSKKTTLRMVEMESSYLTVDFFRKLPTEMEKGGNPAASSADRYTEGNFRRIGSNVSSYVKMVSETLKNTVPKAVVHCQVREAKRSLLDHFYIEVGKKEVLSDICHSLSPN